MLIEQSLNNPDSWRVTDDGGTIELGYIIRATGAYQAYGAKLHAGKGGMRKQLGPFQTLDEAGKAIELGLSLAKLLNDLTAAKQELGSWIDAFGSIEDQVKFIESQDKEVFAAKQRIESLEANLIEYKKTHERDFQRTIESLERSASAMREALEPIVALRNDIVSTCLAGKIPGWQQLDAAFDLANKALSSAAGHDYIPVAKLDEMITFCEKIIDDNRACSQGWVLFILHILDELKALRGGK